VSTEPGHLLVVDDDRVNRMMLSRSLAQAGHTVEAVEGGREALELLRAKPFDAVLLDLQMPEMDGFQVLEQVMSDNDLRHTPVIMVSGFDEMAGIVRCIAMGAADYLHKPFDPELLRARIDNSLEKKRLLEQEVSLRQELEANYRRLQELERLRDSLTHMVVHDLRQPLQSLIGGLQTMETLGDLSDLHQEFLQMSIQGGETLLAMINDLLDISKMEDGSLQLDRTALEAGPLVESAIRQVAQLAREKRVTLAADVTPDLPSFPGDEEKLRRTLVNLLGNAIKFTPQAGSVTVRVVPEPQASGTLFRVIDTGEGIPSEAFGRIFEKFGQVEMRQGGRKMSTGLGLTFCKMAVEAHGGRIWVESEPGRGSAFYFTIPRGND
jgi:signal transduction histidine kinase